MKNISFIEMDVLVESLRESKNTYFTVDIF